MKKIFISQPMKDKTEEEILREREDIIGLAKANLGSEEIEIIDTYFKDFNTYVVKNKPGFSLGKSIMMMSEADLAIFGKGWKGARGCRIEHLVCDEYGINTLELD